MRKTFRSPLGLIAVIAVIAVTGGSMAWAAFSAYSPGNLSLQNGWDSGISGQGFTNNFANSNVVSSADAFTGTQSWRYSGSYGSPGSGTPFTPYVATVGAPNAATAFAPGLNSPVTPAGDRSVISFAFKAVAPGDLSGINLYEGNRDKPDPERTGSNLYVKATSASGVTLFRYNLSSTNSCGNQDYPLLTIATVAAGTWHTVKMTTIYPNVTPSDLSTYGTTTYIIDEGTSEQVTVTDPGATWVNQSKYCGGGPYSPGTSVKWSSSFNDYPTHQGFYIDDVSMTVNNGTATTVGSFTTSFESALLNQAALSVNVTSPAMNGSTQTLTTSGGSGGGAVSYSVGGSTACSVADDQLTITSGTGSCAVTATKATDDVYSSMSSSAVTVTPSAPAPAPAPAPAAATASISASPASLITGNSSTLSWSSSNASGCTASGNWSGSQSGSGSVSTGVLNAAGTYTYAISCTGPGGTANASTTVTATPPATPVVDQPQSVIVTPDEPGTVDVAVAGNTPGAPPVEVEVTWSPGTFSVPVTVTVAPQPPAPAPAGGGPAPAPKPVAGGFTIGTTTIQLTVTDMAGNPVTRFAKPIKLSISASEVGNVPAFSKDGITWTPIPRLFSLPLPPTQDDGYFINADGSVDIYTMHATFFGLLNDTRAPSVPKVNARIAGSKLFLRFTAKDNVKVAKYRILFNGRVVKVTQRRYLVLKARAGTFRVVAVDTAGNKSKPSAAIKVVQYKRGFILASPSIPVTG